MADFLMLGQAHSEIGAVTAAKELFTTQLVENFNRLGLRLLIEYIKLYVGTYLT